jgi:glycosyltransferase involved in cell wall biosynthesis
MPKFLTIFPYAQNVHLVKDVGMIPYVLYKELGYESSLACYENGSYPYLQNEVKGLKQIFIKKRFLNDKLNILLFILKNFKKFDILQVYHFSADSLIFLLFFKILKIFTSSKTYLKLDSNESILEFRFRGISGWIIKKMILSISLITVETEMTFKKLSQLNTFGNALRYLPNGFYDYGNKQEISFSTKKNTILTVGRIGSYQKDNETLLEAFKLFYLDNNDYSLKLVGPIEDEFLAYIDQYFDKNPNLRKVVSFTGPIYDRQELDAVYKESKIFVLSSRYEGFPLVFLEAMKAGCTVVSSDVAAAYDVVGNDLYGRIFKIGDVIGLKKSLEILVRNNEFIENNCRKIQKRAYEKFAWVNICKQISTSLQ